MSRSDRSREALQRRRPGMPTFTMRLPDEDYEDLQAMALLTGQSMAELVRDAVSASLTNFASNKLDQRYTEELKARNLAFEKLKKRLDRKSTRLNSSHMS